MFQVSVMNIEALDFNHTYIVVHCITLDSYVGMSRESIFSVVAIVSEVKLQFNS